MASRACRLPENPETYVAGGDTGDYNGDGHLDALLARARHNAQGGSLDSFLELYSGNGRGGFGPVQTIGGLPLELIGIRTGDPNRTAGWTSWRSAFGK